MKRRILLLLACSLFVATQLFAVPANPEPVTIKQPDGTEITVRARGDEKIHWMETLDGYTLMYDSQHYVVYATKDAEGNLVPSTTRYYGDQTAAKVQGAQQFLSTLQKGLFYNEAQVNTLRQIWAVADEERSKAPVTGERKALCILMNYPNLQMVNTREQFDALINQVGYTAGGANGSVRDFYLENSYGQMTLKVTVVGPYMAKNNYVYYGDKNGSARGRELAVEAINAADADVDFKDFATNNVLETFHMIFAGYGAENFGNNSDYIWSHKWQFAQPVYKDGVKISVYSCSPERRGRSGNDITYIGVICHELCHVFGSPDYYDTNSATGGQFEGTGDWDLMAGGSWNNNGRTPAHINMFQKILYNWVTPEKLTSPKQVTDMPNSAKNAIAYTIEANPNGEMYVLENRQKVGYDAYVPGTGLLIYHVHKNALNGNGSNATHPQQVYPVCASSTVKIPTSTPNSYGNINSAGCPFPGTSGKKSFTDDTTPAAFYWSGTTSGGGINKPILNITEANKLISFTFMEAEIKVTGVSLSPTTTTIYTGEKEQLTAQVLPTNATNKKTTWTSSNTAVATVSTSGLVQAKTVGATTITVKTEDGGYTATCEVTVKSVPVTGVSVSPASIEIIAGETNQLEVAIQPTNASNKNVTWTSSNTSIATVSASGEVKGIAGGTATITATTEDGGYTATCEATILALPVLETLTLNGIEIETSDDQYEISYQASCGKENVELDIAAIGTVTVNGEKITGKKILPFSSDKMDINLKIAVGDKEINHKITALKAIGSSSQPLYVQRWGATLAVINNPANNGGYTFTGYKWYKEGTTNVIGTGEYIVYKGNGNVTDFYAEVKPESTGEWHQTCRNLANLAPANLTIYPNPVAAGQQLTLELPQDVNKVSVGVYDINGQLVKQHENVYNAITMPTQTGIYVLNIQLPDGTVTTHKIIVK